ncbi:Copia protein, partial [Mucuna pruriens]
MKTYHPEQQILRDVQDRVRTRSTFKNHAQVALLSKIEPKSIDDTFWDEGWNKAISLPEDKFITSTMWVFINKLDKNGYPQQEEIYFIETFSPIARLEFIRILLSFATHKHMRLCQMDVRCAFLNGIINEEVYVKQPLESPLWNKANTSCFGMKK